MTPNTESGLFDCVIDVKLFKWLEQAGRFRKINGWMTVLWFLAAFPICLFLSNSVPFLVFISVYAVVTGHLSTWQAAKVEARQEADDTEELAKAIYEYLEGSDKV